MDGELQNENMNIAITIPTGRPRVKQVVKAFLDNAISHGYDLQDFSVYLSIDTTFKKSKVRDYVLNPDLESRLKKVVYISPGDRKETGLELISDLGLDPLIAKTLFSGRGYSKQRNSALLYALRDGNDFAVCFDDDEAPVVPVENDDGKLEWHNLDFFGPHLKSLGSGADITRGPCLGYISPIPSGLEKNIPENIRRRLGEVLNIGNEVIDDSSFLHLMDKIQTLSKEELIDPSRPFVVEETPYGKTILSGNMGINLDSVRKGRIPIFYTPPNARGEDALFALQLGTAKLVEVPSYIFHDPFELYPGVLKNKYPSKLRSIPVTKKSKERFADAIIGWLKYAPLLIHMSAIEDNEKTERIEEMIGKIDAPTKRLAELLNCPRLSSCRSVLQEYQDNVTYHYDNLVRGQRVWKKVIVPYYSGELKKIK